VGVEPTYFLQSRPANQSRRECDEISTNQLRQNTSFRSRQLSFAFEQFSLRINAPRKRVAQSRVAISFQNRHLLFEFLRLPEIVRIEQRDIFPGGFCDATIPRGCPLLIDLRPVMNSWIS